MEEVLLLRLPARLAAIVSASLEAGKLPAPKRASASPVKPSRRSLPVILDSVWGGVPRPPPRER